MAYGWRYIGLANYRLEDYLLAEEYLHKALRSDLENFGSEHLNTAKDWEALGLVLEAQDKLQEALSNYEKAYRVYQVNMGNRNIKTINVGERIDFVKSKLR